MNKQGLTLAAAAATFIGTPFLLHSRNPGKGLDCIGLVAASLEAIGCEVSQLPPYSLRQSAITHFLGLAKTLGLMPVARHELAQDKQVGDIVLLKPGPAQHHLAIRAQQPHIIHAHAGLRRVTFGPMPSSWEVLRSWRLP